MNETSCKTQFHSGSYSSGASSGAGSRSYANDTLRNSIRPVHLGNGVGLSCSGNSMLVSRRSKTRSDAAIAPCSVLNWSDRLRTGSKKSRTYWMKAISVPMVRAERMASVPPYQSIRPSAAVAIRSMVGQRSAK